MHMTFEKVEHRPPIDCTSAEGTRCDVCFGPMPQPAPEHPAYRAAELIRQLHAETIEKIDGGFIFLQDGVDCSAEMRAKCAVQVALCEQIMARAKDMSPVHTAAAGAIFEELEAIGKEAAKNTDGLATIPEIGNYDHGK